MTKHIRDFAPSGIENVSRRGVLKGMVSTGGLVLALTVMPPPSSARRRAQMGRGRHAARHGEQSSRLRVDSARRNRHHRLPPLRHGARRANRHAAHRRRRARGRLDKSENRAGDRRRGQIRQPGHGRIAFDPSFLRADAPGWRRRAHDAGRGRGQALGRRSVRRGGEEPRGRSEVDRQDARLRRTRRRRQQADRPADRQPTAQGPFAVPLHRQGRDQYRRRLQHHDRPRHLWSGCPLARAEVRRRRATGGHGRQGGVATTRRRRRRSQASSRSSRSPRRPTR